MLGAIGWWLGWQLGSLLRRRSVSTPHQRTHAKAQTPFTPPPALTRLQTNYQQGNCKITSRVLASGGTGLQISFPCSQSSATHANLAGPALNLWAALSKAAPASCSVTTLNPALYYKRVPPAYYYGYEVSKLACKELDAAAASAALKVGDQLAAPRQGARMGVQYGLWLVPELRTVSGLARAFVFRWGCLWMQVVVRQQRQ